MAASTLVDYLFCHLICSWLVKSRSVCFSHNGPRGCMMTTGPRVDIVKNYLTFFWRYTFMTSSSRAFPVQLSLDHSEGLGSTDDLSSLRMYAMYGIVQSGVMTKTSMSRSTTAGTSTSVGSVALFGCGASSVKGSS